MAKINLLPWRQERRKEQQRQFFTLIGLSAMLVVLIVVAVFLEIHRQIGVQQNRNTYLKNYLSQLEDQIKKVNELEIKEKLMEERMKAITNLQRNRPEMVHLFDELVRVLPEGVHLESIKQNGNSLDFIGFAQSNARVSSFMRNIDQSMWFDDPQLIKIEEDNKSKDAAIRFNLKAKHVNPEFKAAKAPKPDPNKPATGNPATPVTTPTPAAAPATPATGAKP